MEVLPALENLSLDGLGPSGSARDAKPFIAARQLTDRPWSRPTPEETVSAKNQFPLLISLSSLSTLLITWLPHVQWLRGPFAFLGCSRYLPLRL